jgi:hypothetical protein
VRRLAAPTAGSAKEGCAPDTFGFVKIDNVIITSITVEIELADSVHGERHT